MYKGLSIFTGTLMILFLPLCFAEPSGMEIMKEQEKRQKVETEYTEQIVILADADGSNKEKRLMRHYSKEMDDGTSRALMVFMAPADIAGTALLTWENKDRESDQWLYLPAQKKVQRVAKGSKKNYFMGTDFTYEDMEPEDIDNFQYTVLRSETIDSVDYWVVEAVPANKKKRKESAYSKRLMWIDKQNYVTFRLEFYDRRDRLIKTQTGHAPENIEETVWRFKKGLMNNASMQHKTLVGTRLRKINEPIDDSVFTERFILSGKHMQ